MIQLLTKLNIIDNSGGKIGTCIKILHPKGRNIAKTGDIILVSVNKTIANSKVKRGGVYKALIVTTKKILKYRNKEVLFNNNSIVLIKQAISKKKFDFNPIGTRLKGPISAIIKRKPGCLRIHYLARSAL